MTSPSVTASSSSSSPARCAARTRVAPGARSSTNCCGQPARSVTTRPRRSGSSRVAAGPAPRNSSIATGIACRPVRDVLVDYLAERQTSADFSSLQRFAYLLGKLFWADLEAHHPGIDSLKLPREVAAAWKERVMTKTRGGQTTARLDGRNVLSAVRAFYLDLAEWAEDDPARWGPFAFRSPVSANDVSHKKDRLRRKSRMDQRTRERLPVLPALVRFVAVERHRSCRAARCGRGDHTRRAVQRGGRDAPSPGAEDEDDRAASGAKIRRADAGAT